MKKNNGQAPVDQGTYLWLINLLRELQPGQVDEKSLQSFMFELLENQALQSFEPHIQKELIARIDKEGQRLGIPEHDTQRK